MKRKCIKDFSSQVEVLLLLTLIVFGAPAMAAPDIVVGNGMGEPGDTVSIPLTFTNTNPATVAAIQFDVVFVGTNFSNVTPNCQVPPPHTALCTTPDSNTVRVSILPPPKLPPLDVLPSGSLGSIDFTIVNGATPMVVPLQIGGDIILGDTQGEEVTPDQLTNGSVTIQEIIGPPNCVPPTVTPTNLGFGQILVGSMSGTQDITINNPNTDERCVVDLTQINGTVTQFGISTTDCTVPGTLAAGASCSVSIFFKPTSVGVKNETLSIDWEITATEPDLTGTLTVGLTGTGTVEMVECVPPTVTPTNLGFGQILVGSMSGTQDITINNPNTDERCVVDLTQINGTVTQFGISTTDCTVPGTLAAGASCTASIFFKPTSVGVKNETLPIAWEITATNPDLTGTLTVGLTGEGIPVPPTCDLTLNPTILNFSGPGQQSTTLSYGPAGCQLPNNTTAREIGAQVTGIAITPTPPFSLGSGANACPSTPFGLTAPFSCNIYVAYNTDEVAEENNVQTKQNGATGQLTVTWSGGTLTTRLTVINQIPTLSEWAMIILGSLMLLGGALTLRQRDSWS